MTATLILHLLKLLSFVALWKADEWMMERDQEVQTEFELEAIFPAEKAAQEVVVKQHVPGEITCQGNAVFKGTLRCGKLSFFTHWTPPAMLGACELHEDCYTTAPLLGSVTEHELVAWIGEAPSFQNGSAHMSTLPSGCYKHRGVTSAKITQL